MIRTLLAILMLISPAAAAENPKRIVSVGGALTETVYALGAGHLLVGSDTTSYFPEAAAQLPKVGYQRTLSAEGVLSLDPDLIILSADAGPPNVLEQLKTAGVPLLRFVANRSIADIKRNIREIGSVLERDVQARQVVATLEETAARLERAKAGQERRKRIMFILQHGGGAPLVAGRNTAADRVITLAGAENAVTGYVGYKPLSPEAAVETAPDIILVTTQGLRQFGGEAELIEVPGVNLTPAAKQRKVIAMDALFLLGFGPRTAAAALELNHQVRGF